LTKLPADALDEPRVTALVALQRRIGLPSALAVIARCRHNAPNRMPRPRRRHRGRLLILLRLGQEFERAKIKDAGRIDVYTPAEIEALARHAASVQDAAMFRIAAYAGLRRSEIRALRWREIDFATVTIRVRSGYTDEDGEQLPKSRRVRSVPLIDQAAAALNDLSRREHFTDPDDLVFPNEVGDTLSGDVIHRRYVAAAEGASLYRLIDGRQRVLRFHDLRHTFGTLAVQIWPVTDVQAYMGHAQISTTMRYVHFKPHTDAAAKLGALVAAAANADGSVPAWDRLGTATGSAVGAAVQ
jgi:integrase